MRHTQLVNYTLFQIGWFACVLGAASQRPWRGCLVGMILQFATTFRLSLRSVVMRPVLAVLFGAAGGPIAFLAGERLGAVTLLPPLGQSLFRLSISWAVALVAFSVVVHRIAPERGADYRHA